MPFTKIFLKVGNQENRYSRVSPRQERKKKIFFLIKRRRDFVN